MTFAELYQKAKEKEKPVTPATAFILEAMGVTKRSEVAVRRWCLGLAEPDDLAKEALAKHFGLGAEELFPKKAS